MEQPYESITFSEHGATGHTFGCDCCVDEILIPSLEVIVELDRTATMYHRLSDQYSHMAGTVHHYGLSRVLEALRRWKLIVETHRRYDAALHHDADPGSAGNYGEDWSRHGTINCHNEWRTAQARFSKADQRIAKAMNWEEVW
jgi:hypothetical protein